MSLDYAGQKKGTGILLVHNTIHVSPDAALPSLYMLKQPRDLIRFTGYLMTAMFMLWVFLSLLASERRTWQGD